MSPEQITFLGIAGITVLAALAMVGVGSVFRAALLMVVVFLGIGALYMTMGAGFLGIIQILIYVGAIAVLMIFAIMLTPRVMNLEGQRRFTPQWPLAAALALALFGFLATTLLRTPWPVREQALTARDYAIALGTAFVDPGPDGYLLPFEVASLLLLVALVGAIVVAREE